MLRGTLQTSVIIYSNIAVINDLKNNTFNNVLINLQENIVRIYTLPFCGNDYRKFNKISLKRKYLNYAPKHASIYRCHIYRIIVDIKPM